jgi:DNA-binding MarR family transcriptional regulator
MESGRRPTHIGESLATRKFRLQPRFTIIHHPVREKFGLSFSAYAVIDSIHQLSHRPDHPWCSMPKEKLAKFLNVTRKTVHVSIAAGIEKGLLEKSEGGDLRTTGKWVEYVVLYEAKEG